MKKLWFWLKKDGKIKVWVFCFCFVTFHNFIFFKLILNFILFIKYIFFAHYWNSFKPYLNTQIWICYLRLNLLFLLIEVTWFSLFAHLLFLNKLFYRHPQLTQRFFNLFSPFLSQKMVVLLTVKNFVPWLYNIPWKFYTLPNFKKVEKWKPKKKYRDYFVQYSCKFSINLENLAIF